MVVAVNSLALEERVEKLKTQYFSEGKDSSLDEKGKSHLHSLLDDFGYEETNGIFCRTRNNSVDIFVERNLPEKIGGFTYLCLTSPKEVLEFREKYHKYTEEEKYYFPTGLGMGMVGGIMGALFGAFSSIETFSEIKEALYPLRDSAYQAYSKLLANDFAPSLSLWIAFSLPIVLGGIMGGIYSHDWKKNKEKNDKEFQERYLTADKKYTVGKMAVESALSSSS